MSAVRELFIYNIDTSPGKHKMVPTAFIEWIAVTYGKDTNGAVVSNLESSRAPSFAMNTLWLLWGIYCLVIVFFRYLLVGFSQRVGVE